MERRILRENEEEIVLLKEEEEDDDDDEALSLCDLPNNEEKNQTKKEVLAQDNQDFDFNSCGGNLLNESEMCTADQVFYKGQILPLRHSISFPSDRRSWMMDSILRSESMDDTNSSSRSSSIRSQRSSSSGSSSNYKPKIRNQFHSHPSPTPQVRFTKVVQTNLNTNKSTLWSLFRVGLVTTPEIALQDLKTRSRNSNDEKKKKERFFLGGTCKCSANSVDEPRNVVRKTRKKTEKDKKEIAENVKGNKRQAMSRHRTFEWLRQLSLEEGHPVDETKRLHQSVTHA